MHCCWLPHLFLIHSTLSISPPIFLHHFPWLPFPFPRVFTLNSIHFILNFKESNKREEWRGTAFKVRSTFLSVWQSFLLPSHHHHLCVLSWGYVFPLLQCSFLDEKYEKMKESKVWWRARCLKKSWGNQVVDEIKWTARRWWRILWGRRSKWEWEGGNGLLLHHRI